MKFTYIKLSKNQQKINEEKIQNEFNNEKVKTRGNVERILGIGNSSKGKRYLDKKDKSEKQKILNVNSEERFLNKSYKNVEDNYKNENRKERAKKILSKNQVALYTISLMLIASGYFNYTNNLKMAELGDAQLVSTNLSVNENEVIDEENENSEANVENSSKNIVNEKVNTENQMNETNVVEQIAEKNTNETIPSSNNTTGQEYFTQTKLERDKMYSQMIETYEKILENDNISTDQKNTASEEIKNINNKRNGIATSETLIKAKGIEEVVIIVNSDVIDAIIKSKDNLDTEQVAQVSNIISRELNANIENIHITTHE